MMRMIMRMPVAAVIIWITMFIIPFVVVVLGWEPDESRIVRGGKVPGGEKSIVVVVIIVVAIVIRIGIIGIAPTGINAVEG